MKARFFEFSKKANSTKVPDLTQGVELSVVFKSESDLTSPLIELALSAFTPYTYCYLYELEKYFFISDWTFLNGLYIAHLSEDVLATYRSEILAATTFVERSASNYDADISDDLLTSKQKRAAANSSGVSLWSPFDTVGCYIVRVASSASRTSPTGVEMFAMTSATLGSLLSYLYDSSNFTDVIKEEFVKAVFNPMDYIISIKWFPILPEDTGGALTSIVVGWFDTGIKALRVSDYGKHYTKTVKPFDRYYNDWRDRHPNYTKFDLYIPSYGILEIPPDAFYLNDNQLVINMSIDYSTGEIYTHITAGAGDAARYCLLSTICGQIGVDIQVSQLLPNLGGAVQSVSSVLSSVASGDVFGAVSKAVDSVKTVANPVLKTIGSTGSIQGFIDNPVFELSRYVYDCADYPTSVAGRPLMQNVKLSTLSGYCKCGNASITVSALASERDQINTQLNSGFYIE